MATVADSLSHFQSSGGDGTLEFPDNRLLAGLCGEYDRNLAQIEAETEVQISRRGNLLQVHGDDESIRQAQRILESLYERLEGGKPVDAHDVEAAIRFECGPLPSAADRASNPAGGTASASAGVHGPFEIQTRRKSVEPRTRTQADYVRQLFQQDMVFGIGPAGTGKTYLAVAVAVSMYLSGRVERIILSRPAVEAGEHLGFLPGDMKEKVDPYMQPLRAALSDFLPGKQLARLIEDNRIEVAPLAFMRGRTLENAFAVLDEAQNATSMQMKMFLTRMGHGSRMAITGDVSQVDLPRNHVSGLVEASGLLRGIDGIGFVRFGTEDVVRHGLVRKIIEAYDSGQSDISRAG